MFGHLKNLIETARQHTSKEKRQDIFQRFAVATVFVDTRLWKTKHPRKRFQNFRQSCVKQKRIEANCEVVIKIIAPQYNADSDAEPIGLLELYYEGISTLKKKQLPYTRYAFDNGLFTVAAKDIIKQHMAFTMSETEGDDSNGGHDFDDDNDDGNGDNNVEDDPGGSTSDSDAVKEISSSV